jgi:hypothetical protein
MAGKAAFRVIQDSKHVGTVTREQIDKVIREIEAEHSARKQDSTKRGKNDGAHVKR